MSISASVLATIESDTNATSYSFGSLSPAGNALILMVVSGIDASFGSNPAYTPGGTLGLSWTELETDAGGVNRSSLYGAVTSASPGSGTITVGSDVTLTGMHAKVIAVTGADVSSGVASAVVQSAVAAANNVTLSAFADAANGTVGFLEYYSGDVGEPTPSVGTGFTSLSYGAYEDSDIAGWLGTFAQYRTTNDTTVTFGFTGTLDGNTAFGAEIAAAAAAGLGIPLAAHHYKTMAGA